MGVNIRRSNATVGPVHLGSRAGVSAPYRRACPTCQAKPFESCMKRTGTAKNHGQDSGGSYLVRLKTPHPARRKTPA